MGKPGDSRSRAFQIKRTVEFLSNVLQTEAVAGFTATHPRP